MHIQHLVVVGASLAGLRAVEAARKSGFTGAITLIGAEEHLPYDRPPLSKGFIERGALPPTVPEFRTAAHYREDLNVTLRLGVTAASLDLASQAVNLTDGDSVPYDRLIITTGAHARVLQVPGAEGSGVHYLRTLDDATALRAGLDRVRQLVVVGGGVIGAEVSTAARKRGIDVTIVEAAPVPLVRAVGGLMGTALGAIHDRNGVRLLCGSAVASIHRRDGEIDYLELDDGTSLTADLVVSGTGAVPSTDWLETSGLEVSDGVVCNEYLQTSDPNVFAAGDVARWVNPVFGFSQRLENWTSAAEQGAHAARNALAQTGTMQPHRSVPYFWSDWYGHRIQFVGVAEAEEVTVVDGDLATDTWVALYRRGQRLVGALTVNKPSDVMKYRALILAGASWDEGLELACRRRERSRTSSGKTVGCGPAISTTLSLK